MRELSRRDAIEDRVDDHEDRARPAPRRDRAVTDLGSTVPPIPDRRVFQNRESPGAATSYGL
ncbi:MAG: hypothetical protein BGO98_01325 [Myxococcales bacterium 68-20]|nr:MAG: hypothetical protein BGO98_01325 [Myxococcales bacterium 68-20]